MKIDNKKTYIVAVVAIVGAVVLAILDKIDGEAALQLVLMGAGFGGLRHAIAKTVNPFR